MVKTIQLEPFIQTAINQYKKNLKQHHIKVDKFILFGSYVKGTAKEWSDIDLAIISDQFGKDPIEEYVKVACLRPNIPNRYKTYIQPHPISPKDLADPALILAHEIRNNGVKV